MTDDSTTTAQVPSREQNLAKLAKLIKGIRIAMLTTAEPSGAMNSRPMACLDVDFDGTLWFMTKRMSGKVSAITSDQHVNVAYAEPQAQKYASVVGRARLIEDRAKIHELWNPFFKAWFPDGVDDPDIVLVAVETETAEIWDAPNGKLIELIGLAKAALTGEEYDWNKYHQHINLSTH